MFCPTCGARNTAGERFCRTCRTDLADPTAPSDVWAVAAPTAPPYDEFPDDEVRADEFPLDEFPLDEFRGAAVRADEVPLGDAPTVVTPLPPLVAPPGGPPTALVRRSPSRSSRSFVGPLLVVLALGLVAGGIVFLVAGSLNGDDTGSATSVQRTTVPLSPTATALTTVGSSTSSTVPRSTTVTPTSVVPTTVPPTTAPPPTAPLITEPPPTEPPTTPVTVAPTVPTTATPTPNEVALAQLMSWAEGDTPIVEDIVDMWVPQVGAKKIGTKDDGIVYALPDIAANHQEFRNDLGAVLVDSGEYVFKDANLWVSIIPEGFPTSAGALGWCTTHDLGPADCFAKLITHDASIKVTTAYQ